MQNLRSEWEVKQPLHLVHQHRYIRFLNATYPIKWKDAVPELKDWDPEQ